MKIVAVILLFVWVYVLTVLYRSKLGFWFYVAGSVGFFTFGMILIEPYAVPLLQKEVSAVCGFLGELTGYYSSYFNSGILFINNNGSNLSLYVDFECSGIIEILAFLALLIFFKVYLWHEKIIVGILGTLLIFIFNVLRIFLICVVVYYGGLEWYFVSHTIIGRLFFYACTVLLYFYVFTKPQIIRQTLGGFSHDYTG